ncbi:hypothetical protein ACFQZE_13005 [Paenibacillus sp. GCM10027627]
MKQVYKRIEHTKLQKKKRFNQAVWLIETFLILSDLSPKVA